MTREAAGNKKQRDQLRATMRDQGCTLEQIAAEMARQFGFRARQAWRHTHGWTQERWLLPIIGCWMTIKRR